MKKLGFLANLVYALRKRIGWCPEPPTPKDVVLTKMALNKGMVYVEKPSISWLYLLSPIFWWSFAYFFLVMINTIHVINHGTFLFVHTNPILFLAETPVVNPIINILIAMWLIFGVVMPLPFILKREILLTNNEFRIKFGLYKDIIALDDVESIKQVKRPWTFVGLSGGPCARAWMQRSRGILICGVAITKGVKYYVFGGRRTYFKISKRNGDAVCIGVENPEEFMKRWKMLQFQ